MNADTPLPDSAALPKRMRRTREQTREMVLDAAADLFAERGYLGTSLADIAERSGVAKSNIFYFFASKDELWKAAVDHTFNPVHALVDRDDLRDHAPSWELFEGVLRGHILTCGRHPNWVRIPQMEGGQRSWRSQWLAEKHLSYSIRWFRAFLEPYVAAGMIDADRELELHALLSGGAQLLYGQEALYADLLGREGLGESFAADYARYVVSLLRKA